MTGREPLTPTRAFAAAVALADADGLAGLTMRRIAAALGVEAMSLYHHVANKEAILDGMVDLVFAEIELPRAEDGWRDGMRRRAESARTVMLRHPWALGLMDSRAAPGPAHLHHHDAVLGCLRRNGFTVTMAGHAFAVLDSFVYGFVLQELSLPFDDGRGAGDVAGEIVGAIAEGSHPHLVELATERVMQPDYEFADEFGWGLTLVLDGLDRALATAT